MAGNEEEFECHSVAIIFQSAPVFAAQEIFKTNRLHHLACSTNHQLRSTLFEVAIQIVT